MPHVYETDGAAIYRQSFATIRSEAELGRFTPDEEPVVVRMIHAAGMVGLEAHIRLTPGAVAQRPAPGRRCVARQVFRRRPRYVPCAAVPGGARSPAVSAPTGRNAPA